MANAVVNTVHTGGLPFDVGDTVHVRAGGESIYSTVKEIDTNGITMARKVRESGTESMRMIMTWVPWTSVDFVDIITKARTDG